MSSAAASKDPQSSANSKSFFSTYCPSWKKAIGITGAAAAAFYTVANYDHDDPTSILTNAWSAASSGVKSLGTIIPSITARETLCAGIGLGVGGVGVLAAEAWAATWATNRTRTFAEKSQNPIAVQFRRGYNNMASKQVPPWDQYQV
jgi:hypothetical protein